MTRVHFARCCVVLCLSWRVAVAQQPSTPLPAAAASVLAQMDKEILVSKKKAVEALEKVLKDTTKKGDLAGAMAVKQALDRLNAEITAITQNKGGRGAADILGRWQGQGQPWIVEYFPDGTLTCTEKGVIGTWVVNGASVMATFNNGVTHIMDRTPDGWAGVVKKGDYSGAIRYIRAP